MEREVLVILTGLIELLVHLVLQLIQGFLTEFRLGTVEVLEFYEFALLGILFILAIPIGKTLFELEVVVIALLHERQVLIEVPLVDFLVSHPVKVFGMLLLLVVTDVLLIAVVGMEVLQVVL